jgi:hypothetical protein
VPALVYVRDLVLIYRRSWWKDVSSIPEWKATQDWITENIGEMYQKSINFKGLESQ